MPAVREVMSKSPYALEETRTIKHAAEGMRERDVGAVLVTDPDGDLVGIVTDRDIVLKAVAEGYGPDTELATVTDRGTLATVSPDDDLAAVVSQMKEGAVKRVPVVEGESPTGMVTLGDLAMEQDVDHVVEDLAAAAPNA